MEKHENVFLETADRVRIVLAPLRHTIFLRAQFPIATS